MQEYVNRHNNYVPLDTESKQRHQKSSDGQGDRLGRAFNRPVSKSVADSFIAGGCSGGQFVPLAAAENKNPVSVTQSASIIFPVNRIPATDQSYLDASREVEPFIGSDSPGSEFASQSVDKPASGFRYTGVKCSNRTEALKELLGLQMSGSKEESKLGSGANATVYRFKDESTGSRYAVKFINYNSSDRFLLPDKGEILGLSIPPYKGIARICALIVYYCTNQTYSVIRDRQSIPSENHQKYRVQCVVSEYIKGKDLYDILDDYEGIPKRLNLAIQVALQISAALELYHQNRIIYGDMKPENIMISPGRDGSPVSVKLVDAGSISLLSDLGTTCAKSQFLCGTRAYMAPEVSDAKANNEMDKNCGTGVDLWGLGITLILVVTDANLSYLLRIYYREHGVPMTEDNITEWNNNATWCVAFAKMGDETKRKILYWKLGCLRRDLSFMEKYKPLADVIIGLTQYDPKRRMTLENVQKTLTSIRPSASSQEDIRNRSWVTYV